MSETRLALPPQALREAIAADLLPVRPLRRPMARAFLLLPLAALLLFAAPLTFEVRNVRDLGWVWTWGASALQAGVGLCLAAAALRDAVPGREWSRSALGILVALPLALVVTITLTSWHVNPVALGSHWVEIGLICFFSTLATALPAIALSNVLVLRAFPTRPATTSFLAGLAGGLMADAGWRLFCGFSHPSHVLGAHLSGVLAAGVVGTLLTQALGRRQQRSGQS